jgi:hypothetical protein
MDAYDKINNLSIEDYKIAFENIKEAASENDLKMLKANYEAPNYTVTAKRLAKAMNFANFNAANLRYGSFAGRLCDYYKIKPTENLAILVYFQKINNEWHWTLRENVVKAIKELNWFDNAKISDIISEIEDFKIVQKTLENTTKESLIQSRVGQGIFRLDLVKYWEGCSVTGCQFIDILKASHIKPWRYSTNEERLNYFNGLLLIPNLDALFDSGLISFENTGLILISSLLDKEYWKVLNISATMKLRKLDEQHISFLEFHRENVFRT